MKVIKMVTFYELKKKATNRIYVEIKKQPLLDKRELYYTILSNYGLSEKFVDSVLNTMDAIGLITIDKNDIKGDLK